MLGSWHKELSHIPEASQSHTFFPPAVQGSCYILAKQTKKLLQLKGTTCICVHMICEDLEM